MTEDETVILLIQFFTDEHADNPKGVGYWYSQNYKGDLTEFLHTLEQMKIERTPILPSPENRN